MGKRDEIGGKVTPEAALAAVGGGAGWREAAHAPTGNAPGADAGNPAGGPGQGQVPHEGGGRGERLSTRPSAAHRRLPSWTGTNRCQTRRGGAVV